MKYITDLFPYWRKINNPPLPETTVLAYYKDKYGGHYVVATYTSDHDWWFPGSDHKDYEMVGWQPLPCSPKFK